MNFNDKVSEKMEMFEDAIAMMTGAHRALVRDMCLDYCRVSIQLDEINAKIQETGTTIILKNGNPAKNPDLTTQHQYLCEKNALFSKIFKNLPDGEAKDALAAFVGK